MEHQNIIHIDCCEGWQVTGWLSTMMKQERRRVTDLSRHHSQPTHHPTLSRSCNINLCMPRHITMLNQKIASATYKCVFSFFFATISQYYCAMSFLQKPTSRQFRILISVSQLYSNTGYKEPQGLSQTECWPVPLMTCVTWVMMPMCADAVPCQPMSCLPNSKHQ